MMQSAWGSGFEHDRSSVVVIGTTDMTYVQDPLYVTSLHMSIVLLMVV